MPDIGPEGMHFGTQAAAEQRPAGKMVDDFIRDGKVQQDSETGRWHWDSQGVDSSDLTEEGFDSEEEARRDLEQAAKDQVESWTGETGDTETHPYYLAIQNPKRVPDQAGNWAPAVAKAKAEGHDGLVYRNKFEDPGSDSWVAFSPEQIKHAENTTWDPHNPDVTKAEVEVPSDHIPAMRVPKGGSSCSTCTYVRSNGTECANEYFQAWHGSNKLPAPADEYCSDWYEPQPDALKKEWSEEQHPRDDHGRFATTMSDLGAEDGIPALHEVHQWGSVLSMRRQIGKHAAIAAMKGERAIQMRQAGKLVGIASYTVGKTLHLDWLATAERGYGEAMMKEVASRAAKAGLGVELDSVPQANGFYEHLGMHATQSDVGHGPIAETLRSFHWTPDEAAAFAKITRELREPANGSFAHHFSHWYEAGLGKLLQSDDGGREHRDVCGLPITIENPGGSIRHWGSRPEDQRAMGGPYGYFDGVPGMDGDELDVFLGPVYAEANQHPIVVIRIKKRPDFTEDDEDKVMLGFPDENAARRAFLEHYDHDERFVGSVRVFAWPQFTEWLRGLRKRGDWDESKHPRDRKGEFTASDIASDTGSKYKRWVSGRIAGIKVPHGRITGIHQIGNGYVAIDFLAESKADSKDFKHAVEDALGSGHEVERGYSKDLGTGTLHIHGENVRVKLGDRSTPRERTTELEFGGIKVRVKKADDGNVTAEVDRVLRELEMDGWATLVNPTEQILADVASQGASDAIAALDLGDELFTRANVSANDYARVRAAELVGMRYDEDGNLTENPSSAWAITDSTREMLRGDVSKAMETPMSRQELADLIQQNYAFSESRAAMIARTEISRALIAGNMGTWRESGLVSGTKWLLSSDHDVDDICNGNHDAGVVALGDEYPSGDTEPPAHPNCLVPGVIVSAAGVWATMARRYHGKIVTLAVPDHPDLAVTPNHPILTPTGWVAAGRLQEGDEVLVCARPGEVVARINPEDHHVESCIEEMPRALLMSGGMPACGVPSATPAFHGDQIVDGNIDVVWSARFLRGAAEAGCREDPGDAGLGTADLGGSLHAEGSIAEPLVGQLLTPATGSHSGGPSASLLEGHLRTPDGVGLAPVAASEAEALPLLRKRRMMPPADAAETRARLAGEVSAVKLAGVRISEYAGHVFNLSTDIGFYLANGIVTMNCQCDVSPVLADENNEE